MVEIGWKVLECMLNSRGDKAREAVQHRFDVSASDEWPQ
ncbi:hypothetical protein SAMN05216576_102336 [Ectopseudomonas chengduensis]|uniref:Uncharacterized protein n=2 Tax=Pseudomonadaceae TaxID=135621 RepID=A0A1G6L1N7_9GAMM|nr:hypothetical protein SAMN05216576_102336 [Pseudomonas chengduensis]